MKWVKFPDEINGIVTGEKKFFEPISVPKIKSDKKDKDGFSLVIKEMFKAKGFEEWVTYPKSLSRLEKKAVRRKYEIFCGGFLYYHDIEVKLKKENKNFEHKIFFEWLPKGRGVRIYINSTPSQFNPNPPPPPKPPPPESNP